MRITLSHVGQIKEAEVEVSGLTVIAGVNGTGKSTVGKTLFTVVRALSGCQGEFARFQEKRIANIFETVFNDLRNNTTDVFVGVRPSQISFFRKDQTETPLIKFAGANNFEAMQDLIQARRLQLDAFTFKSPADKERVLKLLENARDTVEELEKASLIVRIKSVLEFGYDNLMHGQVNNIWGDREGRVSLYLDPTSPPVLSYTLTRPGSVVKIDTIVPSVVEFVVPDVALIETPMVLQVENKAISGTPVYWQDLLRKIQVSDQSSRLDSVSSISDRIKKIIGGELVFDSDSQQFLFVKESGNARLFVNNLASGVKVFSVFQRLARNGYLHPGHLLIIDEPENHLHPQWQVRFAEMLVDFVADLGMQIVLTSHSPYFIQAITTYSRRKKMENKTNLYFAEEQDGGAVIRNVKKPGGGDDDPIFQSFYQAYEDMDD